MAPQCDNLDMTPTEVATALADGDIEQVHTAMDDTTREALPENKIRGVWDQLTSKLGALRSVGDGVVVHEVPLTLEHGDAHLQVAYRAGRIVGLVVKEGAPTGRFGS